MTLAVWQSTIQDDAGNAVPAASVEVRDQATLTLSTVYDNAAGTGSALSNPLTADSDGFVRFYATAGRYKIVATAGGDSRTYENVLLGFDLGLVELTACSVYGRSVNTDGSAAAIAASTNNRILARIANALAWVQVTYALLADASACSLLGRAGNSSGVLADIQAGTNDRLLTRVSNVLSFTQLTAGMFPSTVVPDAALSANVLLQNSALSAPGTTPDSVGYIGMPSVTKTADYTVAAADRGKVIRMTSACDQLTVQSSGAPADNNSVGFLNKTGAAATIVQGSGMTLQLAGTTDTGDVTVEDGGMGYIYFDVAGHAMVGGAGVNMGT